MNDLITGILIGGAVFGLIVFGIMTDILKVASKEMEELESARDHHKTEAEFWMRKYFQVAPSETAEVAPEFTDHVTAEATIAPAASVPAPAQTNVLQLPKKAAFVSYNPYRRNGGA